MAGVTGRFHFSVDNLVVSRSLLGNGLHWRRGPYDVALMLPKREGDDFGFRRGSWARLQVGTQEDPEEVLIGVIRIEVTAEEESAWIQDLDADDEGSKKRAFEEAIGLFQRLRSVSERAAVDTIDLVRVQCGQYWLALHGQAPTLVGIGQLYETSSGKELGIAGSWGPSGRVTNSSTAIRPEQARDLESMLSTDRLDLPVAETSLADARLLAESVSPDLPRALLTAAIAAEAKIKATLVTKANPLAADLVQLLLENPRDFSMAASALFDKALQAVAGRSLKNDDPALYRRIGRLFEVRNALAHRGKRPTAEEAKDGVSAVVEVFTWLDAL